MANLEQTRSTRRRRLKRPGTPETEGVQGLEHLRRVLVGPEQSRIEHLEETSGVTAENVARVLPEAVAQSTAGRGRDLALAMEPSMVRTVDAFARNHPEVLGESLAPTIGAAVRKALTDAMTAIVERFNEALERSLSIRAVQWRLEAARTRRPYAEVVMLRTLKYRVEQVLLIHTETSLVLQHVIETGHPAEPPDQVAAMLSAIDSFGREAFRTEPGAHLDKFQLGDLTVWVSRDPWITLAAVVRGTATMGLGDELDAARERIQLSLGPNLDFRGDEAEFAELRSELEPLIKQERTRPARRAQIWLAVAAVVLVAGAIGVLARGSALRAADARSRSAYVEALRSEPGIVLSSVAWEHGRGTFAGLRDPMAPSPEAIFARRGLSAQSTQFAPFVSLDPRIVQKRIDHVLEPPLGVTTTLDAGTLHVAGVAPNGWIDQARLLQRSVPGVERYDESALRSRESIDGLRARAARLEKLTVPFALNQSRLLAQHRAVLHESATVAKRAFAIANAGRLGACLEVIGHADPPGEVEWNQALSEARAMNVASNLVARGMDVKDVRARGAGVWDAAPPRGRSATFHLVVREDAARPGCGATR